jgi:hypothetical protein
MKSNLNLIEFLVFIYIFSNDLVWLEEVGEDR